MGRGIGGMMAAATAGLLALVGCSSGGDSGSATLGSVATSTTAGPSTTAVPASQTTQQRVTVAPATTRPPATDGGAPGVVATPARGSPGMTKCSDVGFTQNSDNVASEIMATGLTCTEAEGLVRRVGGPLGPVNGPPRVEAEGFVCVRTSQSDGRGLRSATYECTNGPKRVTFVRT